MALYSGALREKQSGESTTSNATLFFSAGVHVLASVLLTAVFLPRIGDSTVLGKAVGDSIDFINGVDAFICSVRIIWVEETRNVSCSFTYDTLLFGIWCDY